MTATPLHVPFAARVSLFNVLSAFEPAVAPHPDTARIREAHIFILHYWAETLKKG